MTRAPSGFGPTADMPPSAAELSRPSTGRASWQLINTLIPYLGLWGVMGWLASREPWAVIPLALLAAGLLVRLFIIFHDCGHGSFLASQRANRVVGFITGTLTFAPSLHWWREHALHHARSGNLDRRGTGDIWTMTLQEYLGSPWPRRLAYRLARNPVFLFLIAPFLLFVIQHRFPSRDAGRRERRSVHWTNLALLLVAGAWSAFFGLGTYLFVQGLVLVFAGAAGVWLFYVQHQFEEVYWQRTGQWDFAQAALKGSSYYRLPKVLQWFTGNIGFHHVHHLRPGVPNYALERAHRADAAFREVRPLSLRSSLACLRLRLWDEAGNRLVGYPKRRDRRGLASQGA